MTRVSASSTRLNLDPTFVPVIADARLDAPKADNVDRLAVTKPRGRPTSELELLPLTGAQSASSNTVQFAAWTAALALFETSVTEDHSPDAKAIADVLALADSLGVPRQTAVQDVFDLLMKDAPTESQATLDWLSILLEHGDEIDLDQISQMLKVIEALANPSKAGVSATTAKKLEDKINGAIEQVNADMNDLRSQLGDLQRELGYALAEIRHERELGKLETEVQAYAQNDGAFGKTELATIVDHMSNIQGIDENSKVVSRSEWESALHGITDARDTDLATQKALTQQLAQELVERANKGEIRLDDDGVNQGEANADDPLRKEIEDAAAGIMPELIEPVAAS